MKKFRKIGRLRVLPEYLLLVFLFLASFNLNGSLAEAPLSHAEIAYIEWVAQAQEAEQEEQLTKVDKSSPNIHPASAAWPTLRTDFLRSLMIQQSLALIELERQNYISDFLNSCKLKTGNFPLILYSSEEIPFISIS
ncbi:MAG: hypothetical protein R8P61_12035 [Bacteroidia bacterium]|nr:hypothetical protein [Bacteroidia bacterium]